MLKSYVWFHEKEVPEIKLKHTITERLELLIEFLVTNADDRNFAGLYDCDELWYTSAISTRHTIYLVHNQADLQMTFHLTP